MIRYHMLQNRTGRDDDFVYFEGVLANGDYVRMRPIEKFKVIMHGGNLATRKFKFKCVLMFEVSKFVILSCVLLVMADLRIGCVDM